MTIHKISISALMVLLLSGCMHGPTVKSPDSVPVSDSTKVPDVRGMDLETARSKVLALDFQANNLPCSVECMAEYFGDDVSRWPGQETVIEQEPPAGSLAQSGAQVNLLIPAWTKDDLNELYGPVMPDLVSDSSMLETFVRMEGITLNRVQLGEEELEKRFGADRGTWPIEGTIISQSPIAGERAKDRKASIEIVSSWTKISTPPPETDDIPNAVGLSESKGTVKLASAGFPVTTRMLGYSALAGRYGNALSKWPDEGQIISQRLVNPNSAEESVEIEVADWSRPELFPGPVPNLENLQVLDAIALLDGAGIDYMVRYENADKIPGMILSQDAVIADSYDSALIILTVQEEEATAPSDDDSDGVGDELDQCPGTTVGATVDIRGCSAADLVPELEHGLYTFNPESREMTAERSPAYTVSITLQTALQRSPNLSDSPSAEEFLHFTGKTPSEIEPLIDKIIKRSGRPPLVERWAEKMTMELRAKDPSTATVVKGAENISKRTVIRGRTDWIWEVTPHCVSESINPTDCKNLILVAEATAHIGVDGNYPYTLFKNEEITIDITAPAYLGILFKKYKDLIISAILIPLIGWLALQVFRRFRQSRGAVKKPINTILLLGANPMDTGRLQLATESRAIDKAIQSSRYRDLFNLQIQLAVEANDIDRFFSRYDPVIVHFSAHGSKFGELILDRPDDTAGIATPIESLENLFRLVGGNIRLVVLNACFSETQAQALSEHVDAVIGMTRAIKDKAAIAFSKSFYSAIADGRNLEVAFELACQEAGLEALEGDDAPKIIAEQAVRSQTFVGIEEKSRPAIAVSPN